MLKKFRNRRSKSKADKDKEKDGDKEKNLEKNESPAETKRAISPILNPFENTASADDFDAFDDLSGSDESDKEEEFDQVQKKKRRFGKPKFIKKIQNKIQARRTRKKAERQNQSQPKFAKNMHRVMEERRREQMRDLNSDELENSEDVKVDTSVPLDTSNDEAIRKTFPVIGKVRVTLLSVENICKHNRLWKMQVQVRLPPNETETYLFETDTIGKTYELDLYDISSELRICMHDIPRLLQGAKEFRGPQLGQAVLPLSIFLRETSMFTPIHIKETLDVRLLPLKERYLAGPRYDGMFTPVYPDMVGTGVATSHRNLGMLRLTIEIQTEAPLASLYMMRSIIPERPRYKFDVGLMKSSIARMAFITQTPALLLYISTLPFTARLGIFPVFLCILYYICFLEGGKCLLPFVIFCGICANGFLSFYLESIRQSELVIWARENEAKDDKTALQKLKSLPGHLQSLLNLLLRIESSLEKVPLAFNFSDRSISIYCYGLLFIFTSFSSLLLWLIPAHVFGFMGGTIIAFRALGLHDFRSKKVPENPEALPEVKEDDVASPSPYGPWNLVKRLKDRRVLDHEVCCERMVLNFQS